MPFAVGKQFVAFGYVAALRLGKQGGVGANHAHFQRGGAPDDVFGFGGVGHAGKLHDDAVRTRLLDNGFCRAQFVYAVVQGGDVLFDGIGAYLRQQGFGQRYRGGCAVSADFRAVHDFAQFGQGGVEAVGIGKGNNQRGAVFADVTRAQFFLAQGAADVACVAVKRFVCGCLHVHFHGEMHAAAQIQSEEHRAGTDFFQPFGAVGNLVLRHDVAFAQGCIYGIAGGDFGGIGYAHFQAAPCDKHAVVRNACFLQGFGNGFFGGIVDGD